VKISIFETNYNPNQMVRSIFLLSTLILLCLITNAQAKFEVEQIVNKNMELIRQGEPVDEQLSIVCQPSNFENLIKICSNYSIDTLPQIRKQVVRYLAISALKSTDVSVRISMVNILLQKCFDENSGIVISACNYLKQFGISDYDSSANVLLDSVLRTVKFNKNDIYKLGAYVGNKATEVLLFNKLSTAKSKSEIWHLNLALCRRQNEKAVTYVLENLKPAKINSDFIYAVVPDLIYTRQPRIYDFLFEIIQNPEYKCVSGNPDNEKEIECGYYLIELLANEIEGFPLAVNQFGEIENEITPISINTVREWYKVNKNFRIITNKY